MATECRSGTGFRFQRKLTIDFDGGAITSEAGLTLVREFDERLGPTASVAKLVHDGRDRRYIDHSMRSLLRQRIYQIVAGYEDCDDAKYLRTEPTIQSVAGKVGKELASQPTLSRLENSADWDSIRLLESEGTEWFCRYGSTEGEIILDMDSTEDRTYGQQQLSFFNRHYNSYIYHPLLIFEGNSGALLSSRLRPGNAAAFRQAVSMLRPLVRRLRARFPDREVGLRADSAFATPQILDYAEYAGLGYAIGFGCNSKLQDIVMPLCEKLEMQWECSPGTTAVLETSTQRGAAYEGAMLKRAGPQEASTNRTHLLHRPPALRWISTTSVGTDRIYCFRERQIPRRRVARHTSVATLRRRIRFLLRLDRQPPNIFDDGPRFPRCCCRGGQVAYATACSSRTGAAHETPDTLHSGSRAKR